MLGLETEHGWALMQALALSPSGILLRHFDLLAPDLDPTLRHNARQALRRVSTVLGDARTDPSPMGLVGGCVLSKRVVADLSNFANPEPIDGDRERRSSLPLRLLCPNPTVRLHGPACQAVSGSAIAIPGELAVLTDPSPEVVGVSVDAADLGRLTRALGLPALLR
jgi:hypothetical protein